MKCSNCGKEFGNGITCQSCGTDRFTGLGNYHGYSTNNNAANDKVFLHNLPFRGSEATMICYNCNKIIPIDSKFCPYCSKELYISCPNCGHVYSSKYPACNQCGTNFEKYKDKLNKRVAICNVCGYITDIFYKDISNSYKCPICKSSSFSPFDLEEL